MSSAKREAAAGIHSAAIHLLRHARQVDDEAMGLSPSRASALSVLVFGGARSLGELATDERVTSATMSRLVAALEKDGFVRRFPDVNDARAVRIEPTAKARRILERGRARRLDRLTDLFAGATDAEIDALQVAAELVERSV